MILLSGAAWPGVSDCRKADENSRDGNSPFRLKTIQRPSCRNWRGRIRPAPGYGAGYVPLPGGTAADCRCPAAQPLTAAARRSAADADPHCAGFLQAEQALTQVAECVGEQPGYVHLRDAELLADLRLGHVAVEGHQPDRLLPPGQLTPVRCHCVHVQRVLD